MVLLSRARAPAGAARPAEHHLHQAGDPSYWLLDPEEPSLTFLELVADAYREVAAVQGNQPYDAVLPFPATFVPSELVR